MLMSTTTRIIRAVMKKAKENPDKLSTKAAKATISSVKGVKKAIKDVSLDKADLAAGKAVESIADSSCRSCLEECKTLMQKAARHIEGMEFEDRGIESYLTAVEDALISAVGFIDKSTKKGEC